MEMISGVLSFARIKSTSVEDESKTVFAKVEANEGEDTTPDDEFFGHAAVQYRPPAPSTEGECEVVFARLGDEKVVIASRDKRWQVELADGEVVLRAFGASAAYVHLKPDGSLSINGGGLIEMDSGGDVTINGVTITAAGDVSAPGEVTAQDGSPATSVGLSTHLHPTAVGPTSPPTPGT
jgi:hypothetical protein